MESSWTSEKVQMTVETSSNARQADAAATQLHKGKSWSLWNKATERFIEFY